MRGDLVSRVSLKNAHGTCTTYVGPSGILTSFKVFYVLADVQKLSRLTFDVAAPGLGE